jgi:hypothetical protein
MPNLPSSGHRGITVDALLVAVWLFYLEILEAFQPFDLHVVLCQDSHTREDQSIASPQIS